MQIIENASLKPLNTFGLEARARYYIPITGLKDIQDVFSLDLLKQYPHMVLGGGSNILFTGDYPGIVLHICSKGIEEITPCDLPASLTSLSSTDDVYLKVKAGEVWDELVAYCVARNWGGLENLSLIPGHVGSSPIQNIGAYGVEVKESIVGLEVFEKQTGNVLTFNKEACQFGYRDSYFKREGKNRYVIMAVYFLLKTDNYLINTSYTSLQQELALFENKSPGTKEVRDAVIRIRQRKLPDPTEIGNAGSFFKNPVVSQAKFHEIQQLFPGIVGYNDPAGMKIAAGWLIQETGWKGFRENDAGVHQQQALVLVNHGRATGNEILSLAKRITLSVKEKFDIELEPEVNVM